MGSHDEKRADRALSQLGVTQNYHVFAHADWSIPAYIKARCVVGANWIGTDPPQLFMKDQSGLVVSIGSTAPAPPRADLEREGRRLLEEAVTERKRLEHQGYVLRLKRRAQEDGPASLTLAELRDLAVDQGVDVAAIQQRVREKFEKRSHNETGDAPAGGTEHEEK